MQVFQRMKLEEPDRYMRLEHFCNRTYFDSREVRLCHGLCTYNLGSHPYAKRIQYATGGSMHSAYC